MTKDKFIVELLKEFVDEADVDDYKLTEDLKLMSIDGFDSLSVVSLGAFIKKRFGVNIVEKRLSSAETVGDLIEMIGQENFEG